MLLDPSIKDLRGSTDSDGPFAISNLIVIPIDDLEALEAITARADQASPHQPAAKSTCIGYSPRRQIRYTPVRAARSFPADPFVVIRATAPCAAVSAQP